MTDEEVKVMQAQILQKQVALKNKIGAQSEDASGLPAGSRVIAELEDGGRVVEASDGSQSFTSPGFSTNDPETIEKLLGGSTVKREVQSGFDKQTISQVPGGVTTALGGKAAQGLPFVGQFIDEAMGKISPNAGDGFKQVTAATDREFPKSALAAEVTGGVIGTLPLAIGATGVALNAPTRTGQVVRGASIGGGFGVAEGSVSEAGRAEDGERLPAALRGGVVGGGLGVLLGAFAPLIGEGVSKLVKRVKRLDVRAIADEFGISIPSARVVQNALKNDDLAAASIRLKSLGDDALLADAGPATGQLLNASSSTGGNALAITRKAVSERSDKIGARLTGRLDAILGKPVGVRAAAREIASSTSVARKKAFDKAFSQPINFASASNKIESVIDRIPQDTLRGAVKEANEAMLEAGERNAQILLKEAKGGTFTISELPNVRQLHELKLALDTTAREAVDQFGRPTGAGLRAGRLARDIRKATVDMVPDYGKALKRGGDKIQRDNALALGKKVLFKGTTIEDVKDLVRDGLSKESRDAAKQGIREGIETSLSNVRRTISDNDTAAREAMQAVKELSSRANTTKLRLLIGERATKELLSEMDKAATGLILRGAVARGSDTAIRASIQKQVTAEATPGLLRRTLGRGGNPLDAAKEITETIAGIDVSTISRSEKRVFDEIAGALTRIKGKDARRALFAVRKAIKGQPLKDEEAKLIGRVVGGSLTDFAHQVGTRTLTRQ